MLMRRTSLIVPLLVLVLVAGPAGAITYGQPDGNGHPNVGAVMAEWREPGTIESLCTGTLISPTVFLTAAHCTAFLESEGITDVWVTFDPDLTVPNTLIPGTMHTNPKFNQRQADTGDLAVITFDAPVPGITPATLPPAGRFNRKPAELRGQRFTAVGYGATEPTRGGGAPEFPDPMERLFSVSSFSALNKAWLRLSQNAATGDSGTCFGDSGGPNFLGAGAGETSMIAGVTITGDSMCVSTNVIYRLDTTPARDFLGDFVTLP
jgi:hypothetical protein